MTEVAGIVLAAGLGTRLRPLTDTIPKALVEVGGVPLLDHALRHVTGVVAPEAIAVNAHAHANQVISHVRGHWPAVHTSHEREEPLGTAGALGKLRDWIDGRGVLVHNVDVWHDADVADFARGWDAESIRLLVVDRGPLADFGPWRYAGVSLLPWRLVQGLEPVPTGLYEVMFRDADERGEIDFLPHAGFWFDCGTPEDLAAANRAAS